MKRIVLCAIMLLGLATIVSAELLKDTAGQKIAIYVWDGLNGVPATDIGANLEVKISKDGGAFAALTDTSATETGYGWYVYDLAQAETNCDMFQVAAYHTSDPNYVCAPIYVYPKSATQSGDITSIDGSTTAAAKLKQTFDTDWATAYDDTNKMFRANVSLADGEPLASVNDVAAKLGTTSGVYEDFDPASHSLQALRSRGDAAWITATGFAVSGDPMTLTDGAITSAKYDGITAYAQSGDAFTRLGAPAGTSIADDITGVGVLVTPPPGEGDTVTDWFWETGIPQLLSELQFGRYLLYTFVDQVTDANSFSLQSGIETADAYIGQQIKTYNTTTLKYETRIITAYTAARQVTVNRPFSTTPNNGDHVWISSTAAPLPAEVWAAQHRTLTDSVGAGAGSVVVDHDYGGTDALAVKTAAGMGIDNAEIWAYLKSDYDAGNRSSSYIVARTRTNVYGRWATPMQLDPATYTLYIFKQGLYAPTTVEITVTED